MASSYDETVMDFDLDFLHQPLSIVNDCRIDKQRKAILIAKKKTIATDSLIRKYYAKKERLEETEVVLLAAKEECKQVCIDYKEALDKCSQIEKDLQILSNTNKELESKCVITQNQYEAMKSHAHQLQLLVKEHETVIESLKIEKKLEKNNVKDYEKNFTCLQKDNEELRTHLCIMKDIVLGRKKLRKHHKLLLQKYDTLKSVEEEPLSEDSGDETDFFDNPPTPQSDYETISQNKMEQDVTKTTENDSCVKRDLITANEDPESDYSNELVSEDTGRGSSLAYSDGEKCLNSPDYFADSPLIIEHKNKDKKVLIDSGTSPMRHLNTISIATSPLLFDDEALLSDSHSLFDPSGKEYFITDIPLSTEIVTIKEKKQLKDAGTSPVRDIERVNIATSPIQFQDHDNIQKEIDLAYSNKSIEESVTIESNNKTPYKSASKNIENVCSSGLTTIDGFSSNCEIEICGKTLEEKCLERNNSNNLCDESSNDYEIERILNSMRFSERLITPIPKSPISTRKEGKHKQNLLPSHTKCTDALKLREENKVLHSSIAELTKEVMSIKCILKKQLLMPPSPKKQIHIEGIEPLSCESVDEDISQDPIIMFNDQGELNSAFVWSETTITNKSEPLNNVINKRLSPIMDIGEDTIERENETPNDNLDENSDNETVELYIITDNFENEQSTPNSDTPTKLIDEETRVGIAKEKNEDGEFTANCSKTITFEEDINTQSVGETSLDSSCDSNVVLTHSDFNKEKTSKSRKLSRLEKMRKKLVPKSKIVKSRAPVRKLRSISKPISAAKLRTSNANTTDALINNKLAYEKAVKVMAELKQKNSKKQDKAITKSKISANEDNNNSNNNNNDYSSIILNVDSSSISKELSKENIIARKLRRSTEQQVDGKYTNIDSADISTENIIARKLRRSTEEQINGKHTYDDSTDCSKLNSLARKLRRSTEEQINGKLTNSHSKDISKENIIVQKSRHSIDDQANGNTAYIDSTDNSKENIIVRKLRRSTDEQLNGNDFNIHSTDISKENIIARKLSRSIEEQVDENNTYINSADVSKGNIIARKLRRSTEEQMNEKHTNIHNSDISKQNIISRKLRRSTEEQINGSDTEIQINISAESSPAKCSISTRSRSKLSESNVSPRNNKVNDKNLESEIIGTSSKAREIRIRLKRVSSDLSDTIVPKRILRSSNVRDMINNNRDNQVISHDKRFEIKEDVNKLQSLTDNSALSDNNSHHHHQTGPRLRRSNENNILHENVGDRNTDNDTGSVLHPKQSILCRMLDKYGKGTVKFAAKKSNETVSNAVCKKLEEDIGKIVEYPAEKAKSAMNKLVEDVQHWNTKNFITGLMKYLKDPMRKQEMFNKITCPPAPPMTRSEQVLLFIVRQLESSKQNMVDMILAHIEFSLFQLNRTPEFDVIESLSHFYALVCRYFGLKSRLRLFLLDAMYCLNFKVVPLIKQCLDVWMHILPLAHMGVAKSPLVTCLVYLLHFYKCEDKFNRIQDIRYILNKKYFYQITDWNEHKILEMFRNSIKDLRDIPIEKKMLRMAFIILAKRQGPKWCQKNIVKDMFMPIIEKQDAALRMKYFCIELLGPLLKPYPMDMKVHCEIVVNQLLDMLNQNPSDTMKEAIFTSLIYMNKHNQNRVTHSLLSWMPNKVSLEFEELMRDFVREKPVKVWKGILSRMTL